MPFVPFLTLTGVSIEDCVLSTSFSASVDHRQVFESPLTRVAIDFVTGSQSTSLLSLTALFRYLIGILGLAFCGFDRLALCAYSFVSTTV